MDVNGNVQMDQESVILKKLLITLKRSVEKTFNFFVGNHGIDNDKIYHKNKFEFNKKKRENSTANFFSKSNDESVKELLNLPIERSSISSLPVLKSSSSSASNVDVSSVKYNSCTMLSNVSTKKPLDHIVFSRPLKIRKNVSHPPWKLKRVIAGHQGWVRALSINPTNEWLVSGGNDRLIKLWNLCTGNLELSLTGHINTIRGLEFSKRHPYFFSCGEDEMVKCWDLEYNKVIRHYSGHLSGVYCLTVHPTLDILATGGRDAVVRVWDMRTKHSIHVLSGHTGAIMSLVSQKAEPQLISGSFDKMIRCWDLVAGKSSVVLTHHKKSIRSLEIHPREYTFCSAAADHIKVWKCPKGQFERNLESVNGIINSVAIRDQDNEAILIGGSDQGQLHFWDWDSGRKFQTIETIAQPGSLSAERGIFDVKVDYSGVLLVTAECDKTIKIWSDQY